MAAAVLTIVNKQRSPPSSPLARNKKHQTVHGGSSVQDDPVIRAACVLQNTFRAIRARGTKLHRHNLTERLTFEWNLSLGAFRLFCQIMAFVLLIVAVQQVCIYSCWQWLCCSLTLVMSAQSPTSTMRALYHSIDSAFDLEALKKLPNREAFFKHGLGNISTRSKDFFPLVRKQLHMLPAAWATAHSNHSLHQSIQHSFCEMLMFSLRPVLQVL